MPETDQTNDERPTSEAPELGINTDRPTSETPNLDTEGSGGEPVHLNPDGDSFPRAYVEQLRDEAARYRQRAGRAEEGDARLLTATIKANAGDLADPTDLLVYVEADTLRDDDGWPDPDLITAAVAQLVTDKPHLARRRPVGNIGQGATAAADTVNLADLMRGRA